MYHRRHSRFLVVVSVNAPFLSLFLALLVGITPTHAASINADVNYILSCADAKDPCNIATPELWLGGVLPGPDDDATIDLSNITDPQSWPSVVFIYSTGPRFSVGSLTCRGFLNGTTSAVIVTIVHQIGDFIIATDLNLLTEGGFSTEPSTRLFIYGRLNSSSDEPINLSGEASIARGVNMSAESSALTSTSDLFIAGDGFTGTIILSGSGNKTILGAVCLFVDFTSTSPVTISCEKTIAYDFDVDKNAMSITIAGDFTVQPDPDAKGPSGRALFSSPATFLGFLNLKGPASCEFQEAPGPFNSILLEDSSTLIFSISTTTLLAQNIALSSSAQMILASTMRISGNFTASGTSVITFMLGSELDMLESSTLYLFGDASFTSTGSGGVRVRNLALFELIPHEGKDAIMSAPLHVLGGLVRTTATLILRADAAVEQGTIQSPRIIQENVQNDKGPEIKHRLSGAGLLDTTELIIQGLFEPGPTATLYGNLTLLPRSTLIAEVGPGAKAVDARINGHIFLDNIEIIVDERTTIVGGVDGSNLWTLFRDAQSISATIVTITSGFEFAIVEHASGFEAQILRIVPPSSVPAVSPVDPGRTPIDPRDSTPAQDSAAPVYESPISVPTSSPLIARPPVVVSVPVPTPTATPSAAPAMLPPPAMPPSPLSASATSGISPAVTILIIAIVICAVIVLLAVILGLIKRYGESPTPSSVQMTPVGSQVSNQDVVI